MSARAVARSAIVGIAAALVLVVPARANDAAHRIAEKFAGETGGADAKKTEPVRKAADTKKPEAEPADAAGKREAEQARKLEAQKREAQKKAEAARKAAKAKRRAAAKAGEDRKSVV